MEHTERKTPAKVWPKDFIPIIKKADEKVRTGEKNLDIDIARENSQEKIGDDDKNLIYPGDSSIDSNASIIKVYPYRVEAKVINVKRVFSQKYKQ